MSVFRLVIAWLVMAALPLQGIAAASMLFCDQAAHAVIAQPAAHDHAAHGHTAHDHTAHANDHERDNTSGSQDDSASNAEQHAKLDAEKPDGPQGGGLADDGHACPICASCCNLVALFETPMLSVAADSPAAQPLQGPARVFTRHSPTPDKPPRA